MIKFFRNIRTSLLREGKTGKYLKYALGEIVLVVIGILIALQINNWNENRKLQIEKSKLIDAMIFDFTNTEELLNITWTDVGKQLDYMNLFYEEITQPHQGITVDSLKYLMTSFFQGHSFKPNLSSYYEAQSTGKLGLLHNKELLSEITQFLQSLDGFDQMREISLNTYFMGPTWEFRKEQGSLAGFTKGSNGPKIRPHRSLTYDEIVTEALKPQNTATLENAFILNMNIYNNIKTMLGHTQRIIDLLKKMKEEKR